MYQRRIKQGIINSLTPQKVTILYGPRQVGKTTIVKEIAKEVSLKSLYINSDIRKNRDLFEKEDPDAIRAMIGDAKLLIIDEAQRIRNIGLVLKIIIDEIDDVTVIATGSSSFELSNKIQEPLTGRNITYRLYPISADEILIDSTEFEMQNMLGELLVYGSYPDILNTTSHDAKQKSLSFLASDYLYKDVLELQEVRKSEKINQLLKLISFQVGSEVSLSELSNSLNLDIATVGRYIDLLEKNFVLFSLSGFSRNLRKEVSKSNKYYFYDLGIRNILIDNFKSLENRNDVGALWENFILIERLKYLNYYDIRSNRFFWRIYTGAEIDYIEERQGQLYGYEIKWGEKIPRTPKAWLDTYENSSFEVVNRDNYLEFIS